MAALICGSLSKSADRRSGQPRPWAPARNADDHVDRIRRGCIVGLVQLLDLKDLYTGLHSTQLTQLALAVGQRLGLETRSLSALEIGATLHDIGKIGVPDEILQKPGRLTEQEAALVRRHPEFGWQVTHAIPGLEAASLLILHHHERWDGHGYPGGLCATEIPVGSRIIAVVDAFSAMTTSRSYRTALPHAEAVCRLHADSGTQFDPEVVSCFSELTNRSPQG